MTSEGMDRHILIKGGSLLKKLFCKNVPASSGLHLRFPFSYFVQRSVIPQIASTPFLKGCPPKNKRAGGNIRIGFFVGCGTNYLYPDIGYAVLEILNKAGISPCIPEYQGCCGLMAYTTGDQKEAIALAKHTIDLFSDKDLDYIITTCAGCGAHLKAFPELFDTETERRQAEGFSKKVMDATSFLIDVMEYEKLAQSTGYRPQEDKGTSRLMLQGGPPPQKISKDPPIRVVYHEPCHLRIKQKVTDASPRFLRTIPSIEIATLPTPHQCCGHGGTFNLSNFSLSMEILDRKMSEIAQVNPDKIVTGCTGCLLQFQEGVRRIKTEKTIEVLHPLVLWRQQCL
jgi:glycolate oxidase iron-sulfur subunit